MMPPDALAQAIVRAAALVRDRAGEVLARSGLSAEGARWALDTTLKELSSAALHEAQATLLGVAGEPARHHALVLAGNVFTACMRPIAWSLLAGVPVTVKAASNDAGLASLFQAALAEADEALAPAVTVVHFSRAATERWDELVQSADVVSVHGSDATIDTLRARTPSTTAFVAHGHGLGLAVIARDALVSDAALDALALDVAAYDQHGCLSPAAVLVEEGGAVSPRDVAAGLSRALDRLEPRMPRSPMPADVAAAQMQWRGVAAALHELHDRGAHAVAFEGHGPIRETPGHRNVAVHALAQAHQLAARVAPYGEQLKALGTLGSVVVPATVAPIVSPLGRMQRPTLAALTDGLPPWTGLRRR